MRLIGALFLCVALASAHIGAAATTPTAVQTTPQPRNLDSGLTPAQIRERMAGLDREIKELEDKQIEADGKQRAAIEEMLKEVRTARERLRQMWLATRKVKEERPPTLRSTAFTRLAVGLEQAGASASDPTQTFAFDFSVNAPLRQPKNYLARLEQKEERDKRITKEIQKLQADLSNQGAVERQKTEERIAALKMPFVCQTRVDETDLEAFNPSWQLWGNFRFTSVPQQVGAEVQAVAIANSVRAMKANELVRGLTLLGGTEVRFWRGACFPAENRNENALFSGWIFIGAGFITPFRPDDRYELFVLDENVEAQPAFPPELRGSGKKYVAFVPPDQSHFLWQYYLGLRFKTDYVDEEGKRQRYPGVIDLAIGHNEAITGDRKTWVLRLESFYPVPFEPARFVYVFGGAAMRLKKSDDLPALIVNAPSEVVPVPGPDVLLAQRAATARDAWKVGVAIDLLELFKGGNRK